jgi:hypothetical protein
MRAVGRIIAVVALGIVASACIVRSSGPDENRPEQFQFTPAPAGQQETIEAFKEIIGPGGADTGVLDETSVQPLGKIMTSRGAIFFADFQMIDPGSGRSQCSGSAGPGGGGWGCGPVGLPDPRDDLPLDPVTIAGTGSSGTWSDVQLRVGDDVAYLKAVADDGTTYRLEPIAGNAWMEWKASHGGLRVTAYDSNDRPLGSVDAPAS